jgi:PKD domain
MVVALFVVLGVSGCENGGFCGTHPILDIVFCREVPDPSSVPGPVPPAPPAPNVPPTASITPSRFSTTIVDPVELDGSWSDDDGRVTKFEWDLDGVDGYEISGTPGADNHDRRTVTFTVFGFRTVRLRVTDDDDQQTVADEEIYVSRRQPVATLRVTPANPTMGEVVTFDASGSSAPDGAVVRYRWDIDRDNPNGFEVGTTAPTVTAVYDTPGTFTVGVRAFDEGGNRGETSTSLTIAAVPTGNRPPHALLFASPNPAPPGAMVTFNGEESDDPDGDIVEYKWDFDGDRSFDATGASPTQMHSYPSAAVVNVLLRVVDDGGLADEATVRLVVGEPSGGGQAGFLRYDREARGPVARRFSLRLSGRAVPGRAGRTVRRGNVASVRGMTFAGRFRGRVVRPRHATRAESLLAQLLRAGYRARLDTTVDTKSGTSKTTMLALATFARGSSTAVCLRMTITRKQGKKPVGTFRILGGKGAARRLASTGTFTFTPGTRSGSALSGRVKARLARARSLPRACSALR